LFWPCNHHHHRFNVCFSVLARVNRFPLIPILQSTNWYQIICRFIFVCRFLSGIITRANSGSALSRICARKGIRPMATNNTAIDINIYFLNQIRCRLTTGNRPTLPQYSKEGGPLRIVLLWVVTLNVDVYSLQGITIHEATYADLYVCVFVCRMTRRSVGWTSVSWRDVFTSR